MKKPNTALKYIFFYFISFLAGTYFFTLFIMLEPLLIDFSFSKFWYVHLSKSIGLLLLIPIAVTVVFAFMMLPLALLIMAFFHRMKVERPIYYLLAGGIIGGVLVGSTFYSHVHYILCGSVSGMLATYIYYCLEHKMPFKKIFRHNPLKAYSPDVQKEEIILL